MAFILFVTNNQQNIFRQAIISRAIETIAANVKYMNLVVEEGAQQVLEEVPQQRSLPEKGMQ